MSLPAKIGRFKVLKKLGQGGMGVVYLVEDPQTQRQLALKLTLSDAASKEAVERFYREAEVLGRIQHRHVVRVHSVGQVPQGLYLLQECIQGETLDAMLAKGPFEAKRAARLVRDVADAIAAVHAEKILYRDLKPANVMVKAGDFPVLLDFGLARDANAERLTMTGAVVGTPSFMAPEQANGSSPAGLRPQVDVYGLGALLYALLAGRAPFEGGVIQVLAAVIRSDPEWPRAQRPHDVPVALDAIVRVAMSKQAMDRYATATALREDLERFLAGQPTEAARRLGLEERRRRAPLVVAGAGGTLLVAVGFTAVHRLHLRQPAPDAASVAAVETRRERRAPAAPVESKEVREWRARPLPAGVVLGEAPGEYVVEKDGSIVVWVPPGTFQMGSESALDKPNGHDMIIHTVRLTRGFFMGKYEVTQGQYRRFCEATGRTAPRAQVVERPLADVGAYPVGWITRPDADAYCAWAGVSLPTEAQWEFAARGPDSRVHPWGDDPPTDELCNFRPTTRHPVPDVRPIGSFPRGASPFGCQDMAGNVREWVRDVYGFSYGIYSESAHTVYTDPTGPPLETNGEGVTYVYKGCGCDDPGVRMQGAYRVQVNEEEMTTGQNALQGFRICVDVP